MAASPPFKVYTRDGDYRAACKLASDAAVLVSTYGEGSTIRWGHRVKDIVYTDGVDGDAFESFDNAAMIAHERVDRRVESIRLRALVLAAKHLGETA